MLHKLRVVIKWDFHTILAQSNPVPRATSVFTKAGSSLHLRDKCEGVYPSIGRTVGSLSQGPPHKRDLQDPVQNHATAI